MQINKKTYPYNEKLRQAALAEYAIFKSGPDKDYDELTYLAAKSGDFPVAHISVVTRKKVWYKSEYGTAIKEIERENSFSNLAVKAGEEIFILDSNTHPEIFKKLKPHYPLEINFYIGIPLFNPQRHAIAVLSVFDSKPRDLGETEIRTLKALANQTMNLLEFRKQKNKLQHVQRKLKQKYRDLEKFASLVSHDIKSPLANIISLTELLKEENKGKFDKETEEYLKFLIESSYSLRNYVDGILSFYRSDHIFEKDYENVDLGRMLNNIANLYQVSDDVTINYPQSGTLHNVNKAALTQVFMNLVSNALKYNNSKERMVDICFKETDQYYHFHVRDNGSGIPKAKSKKIFELFTTLDTTDRDGNPGSGIGLATVKKHIENMQGDIEVESEPGQGSTFKFKIKRL
ncbi:sensor histidine kinase [Salegentibacter chungangensis]|uniref:histidine kinase n=1 Tax=Salegentibacter chungangensis TaxID=1335724 RepID=A0ABW3NSJ5_9FLAO